MQPQTNKDNRIMRVCRENLPELADQLAARVLRRQDPFSAPLVLVPNVTVRTWLTYRLSQHGARAGERIAINLDFRYLDSGLWEILAGIDPAAHGGAEPVRRLKREHRQWMIVQELSRALATGTPGVLAPLLNYLRFERGGPEQKDTGQAKRLWQLADGLARLFLEYEYHRPDVIREWASSPLQPARHPEPMLEAEQSLYVQLFGLNGTCSKMSPKYLSLPQYFWAVFQETGRQRTAPGWPEVHVFTLPQPSRFLVQIFRELGKLLDLRIYDLATGAASSGPLAQWGQAERTRQALLSELELAQKGEDAKEGAVPAHGVLSCVQAHLQGQEFARENRRQDASIQIGACPSIRREIETVYSNIVQKMLAANKAHGQDLRTAGVSPALSSLSHEHGQDAHATLSLTDFVILVPDMGLYKPVIESVFGRVADSAGALGGVTGERPLLTCNLQDTNAADESVYAQAVGALLALGDEGFTRRELFQLIQNPCFMARQGLERADVEVWLEWAAELNIYRDVAQADSLCHGEGDVFTWQHGLRRLRLGRIMLPPRDALDEKDTFKDLVPYADMESQSAEQVGKFCVLVAELIRSARELRHGSRTCQEWQGLLLRQLERFLEVPSDRREEEAVRAALINALEDLSALDSQLHAGAEAPKFGFALLREMVQGSLISMPTHRGHLLLDGVTVAALQAGHIVPFKHVYILGMGAGKFPSEDAHSALDVRQNALSSKADLTSRDAGRQAMREALLAAGAQVSITYVARDLQKDEEFQPCAIVNELCTYIENEVLADPAQQPAGDFTPFQKAEIPLKGSSRRYLAAAQPEFTDLLCRPCFRHDRFLASPPETLRRKLMAPLTLPSPHGGEGNEALPLPPPARGGGNRPIRLKELADFLFDPVEAILRHRLGLQREEEDDRAWAEDEPTGTEFPWDYKLYTAAQQNFLNLLVEGPGTPTGAGEDATLGAPASRRPPLDPAAGGTPALPGTLEFLERFYAHASRRGFTPATPFRLLDKRRYTDEIAGLLDSKTLETILGQHGRAVYLAIGRLGWRQAAQLPANPEILGPLLLAAQNGQQLEIHSNCLLLRELENGWCEIYAVAGSAAKPRDKTPPKHVFEPLLFYLALRACKAQLQGSSALLGEAGSKIMVLYKNGISEWVCPAWQSANAAAYLRCLAEDYLFASRIEFLPYDQVIKWPELWEEPQSSPAMPSDLAESLKDAVEDNLASGRSRASDLLSLVPIAVPADPLAVARRRLQPVLGLQADGPLTPDPSPHRGEGKAAPRR
ncbi:MAG: exodeoxyribonuclease V subunit gamma, partial [Planctomycetota bacterium]